MTILAASEPLQDANLSTRKGPVAYSYGLFALGAHDPDISLTTTLVRLADYLGWARATSWVVLPPHSAARARWQMARLIGAGWTVVSDSSDTLAKAGRIPDAVQDLRSVDLRQFSRHVFYSFGSERYLFDLSGLGLVAAANPVAEAREQFWGTVCALTAVHNGVLVQHSTTSEGVPGLDILSSREVSLSLLGMAGIVGGLCEGVLPAAWDFDEPELSAAARWVGGG